MFLVVSEEILLSQTELRFAKSATVEFSYPIDPNPEYFTTLINFTVPYF